MSTFAQSDIGQLAYQGDASGLRDELRRRALGSLYYFAKVVMGYKDCSPHLHQEFCHDLQTTIKEQRRGYLIPRRHLKSTLAKSYGMWRLCGGGFDQLPLAVRERLNGDPRNLRIGVFGQTEKPAQKYLKDPKWILQNNEMFQWLFPELVPPNINDTKWTDAEILLPRSMSFDESTIMCFGIDQRKTGYGFDILIYDDIFDEEAAESEELAKAVKEGFDYASQLFVDPNTVEEIIFATRWLYGDADLPGYVMKRLPANMATSRSLDDIEKQAPGRTSGFRWYVRSVVETDPATGEEHSIWPERFTPEVVEAERIRLGPYKFSCLMMNNPIPSEGVNFPPELLKEYEVRNDSSGNPSLLHPLDGSPDVRLSELYRLSFHDPSSGGPSAACESALVALGMAPDCRVFVLKDWGAKVGYGQSVEQWHLLNDQFFFHDNYYEKVGAQKTIEEEIIPLRVIMGKCPYCDQHHQRLIVKPFQPPGGKDKDSRIFAFLDPVLQDKRLYLRKGMTILREQVITHPFSNLKDRLDALASGVSLLRPPTSADELRSEREAEEMAKVHSSRTFTSYEVGGYA